MRHRFRRVSRAAFALAFFLLVSTVLVILTSAILGLCRRQLFGSSSGVDHNRALYAAETGMNQAIAQLETNALWSTGFSAQPTLDGRGDYSLSFASNPSTALDSESVNNLNGSTAVGSYRGPGTVPAHSVLLVVRGHSGVNQQTVEGLWVPGANTIEGHAITASGAITMTGNVTIDGINSLTDLTPVPASLHSNRLGAGLQVKYDPLTAGDKLTVSGAVTCSGSSVTSTAINLAAPSTVGSQNSQVPAKKYPTVNIEAIISDHSGTPGPAIPAVPGAFTLNGGHNFYGGNVVIQGDLTLKNDAKIYVAGNLTVNGSVKGTGALVVKGDTRLHGNADISSNTSDYLSVLSKGSVVVEGFDGQSYMKSLGSTSPAVAERWSDLQFAVGKVQNYLQTNAALTPAALGAQMQADDVYLDQLASVISSPWSGTIVDPATGRVCHQNSSNDLKALVGSGTPTQDFMTSRLQSVDDIFRICWNTRSGAGGRYTAGALVDNFASWNPSLDGGLFDSIQSFNAIDTTARAQVLRNIQLMVFQFDYNRLGSANFKGFVYTTGAFVAKSDINLLGSIIVNGRPGVGPVTVGGVTYQPGDFAVLNNSRITYVDDMFQNGVQNLQGIGTLDAKRWVNR